MSQGYYGYIINCATICRRCPSNVLTVYKRFLYLQNISEKNNFVSFVSEAGYRIKAQF